MGGCGKGRRWRGFVLARRGCFGFHICSPPLLPPPTSQNHHAARLEISHALLKVAARLAYLHMPVPTHMFQCKASTKTFKWPSPKAATRERAIVATESVCETHNKLGSCAFISLDATVASAANCIVEPNGGQLHIEHKIRNMIRGERPRAGEGIAHDNHTHLRTAYRVQAPIEHNICNCKAIGATTHITLYLMLRNCITRRLLAMQLHKLE